MGAATSGGKRGSLSENTPVGVPNALGAAICGVVFRRCDDHGFRFVTNPANPSKLVGLDAVPIFAELGRQSLGGVL